MSSTERLRDAVGDRYRITRELGAGGMATVYLAHDLKHDREVAIKVVHQELAAALGGERFLAEIKTTARLQHPHILPLLDSGEAGGTLYYVMPFVAGESLRDRLDREKQLPIEDAISIAREVADALGYAHGHGIVHRDIKPENILLQGTHAAVADFGIALAVQSAGGPRLTQTGLSLGTPNYMSPEQAMGDKTIDARSDIYALGAVTYEMLTGEPPFTGANVQAIVAKVLSDRPRPPSMVRDTVPPEVDAAVLKCLAKLPADRFPNAPAFATALTGPPVRTSRTGAIPRAGDARPWRLATVALALTTLVLAGVVLFPRGERERRTVTRAELEIGRTTTLTPPTIEASPDGRSVVYCNGLEIWIRRLEDMAASVPRAGSGGCFSASFSPDGRQLAVLGVPNGLRIVSLTGEAPPRPIVVSELPDVPIYGGGIEWAADGNVYIASRNVLLRIAPDQGTSAVVARVDSANVFRSIDVMPEAKASVVAISPRAGTQLSEYRIAVVDHSNGSLEYIQQGVNAKLAGDHLIVARDDGKLFAVPFDLGSRSLRGTPVVLGDSLTGEVPALDVTVDGTLVYWRTGGAGYGHPVLVDRDGTAREVTPRWSSVFLIPRISADGSRMVVEQFITGASDAWLRDLRTGVTQRLTSSGSTSGRPTWNPDGRSISVISDREGTAQAYRLRLDDASMQPLGSYESRGVFHVEWARGGEWLILRTDDQASGKGDIVTVRPGVDSVARPLVATEFSEYAPAISPDGKYLAYVSNQSGRFEVWVCTFPDGQGRWQVSSTGATEPLWSRSGKELFYVTEGHLVSAAVTTSPSFQASPPARLFPIASFVLYGVFNRNYDVMPDDRRFLMIRRDEEQTTRLMAVFNWRAQLERK
ncbi:MAG TPA: protein kinase [Gemmatimonadaceae bacterium]|nr:protein kinase [Gemmatimonadaceae bacterium]